MTADDAGTTREDRPEATPFARSYPPLSDVVGRLRLPPMSLPRFFFHSGFSHGPAFSKYRNIRDDVTFNPVDVGRFQDRRNTLWPWSTTRIPRTIQPRTPRARRQKTRERKGNWAEIQISRHCQLPSMTSTPLPQGLAYKMTHAYMLDDSVRSHMSRANGPPTST